MIGKGLHEVASGVGDPKSLKKGQAYIEFASGSDKIFGLWAGDKGDTAKVIKNLGVQFPGDGNDYSMDPTDKYVGADTTSSAAQITLPDTDLIEDGHEVIIDDDGGNATNNNITIATPGSETMDTSTISTNDGQVHLLWDAANTNWVDVS